MSKNRFKQMFEERFSSLEIPRDGSEALAQGLLLATEHNASDIHFGPLRPPALRIDSSLVLYGNRDISPAECKRIAAAFLNDAQMKTLQELGDVDVAFSFREVRIRANVFSQKDGISIALRIIPAKIPSMEQLRLPEICRDLCTKRRGLILVTGPTGSGKSTTLAAMIDHMNHIRADHIITVEDPIEYVHTRNDCIIDQRQLGSNAISFSQALRSALRQDPDIILVGEMRDLDTISTAITAAETGHLVLSTLHTVGASTSMDRIIDVFPSHQQQQVRTQLSSVVEAVISQQILPMATGKGRIAAFEVMLGSPAIRNLIRQGQTHQIDASIQTSRSDGMCTMDNSLLELYRSSKISREDAIRYSVDKDSLARQIGAF